MEEYLCPACEEEFKHAVIKDNHDAICLRCGSRVGMRDGQLEDLKLIEAEDGIMDDEVDSVEEIS